MDTDLDDISKLFGDSAGNESDDKEKNDSSSLDMGDHTNSSGLVEDLVADLGNSDFEIRKDALVQLEAIKDTHERNIAIELIKWIKKYADSKAGDNTSFVSKAALDLFQNMSEKGLEPLINDCLKNGDYFMRRVAVDALGRTGRLSVLPYLVISIDDSDKYTRWHAAKGLGRFVGSSEARDALIRGLADKDPYVRRRSARSLEKFGGIGPSEDIETEEEQIDDGLSSDVAGPLEENGEGDIDGDGISDSEDEEPRNPDYDSMTVAQLKDVLKEKGLAVSGKKADLVARLKE